MKKSKPKPKPKDTEKYRDRFRTRVLVSPNGHWYYRWPSLTFYNGKATMSAVRASYELEFGSIPTDERWFVRSTCGVNDCINPEHLGIVRQKDLSVSNRMFYTPSFAKLTEEQAYEILVNKDGLSPTKLAAKYNVTRMTIWRIRKGQTWLHLSKAPSAAAGPIVCEKPASAPTATNIKTVAEEEAELEALNSTLPPAPVNTNNPFRPSTPLINMLPANTILPWSPEEKPALEQPILPNPSPSV